MSNPLNAVLKYELTRREADAYKVGIIFSHLCKKMFPDAVPQGFGAGDPRKKVLFKHCWKMLDEVEGRITPAEHKLFVYAQLAIIKSLAGPDRPPNVTPHCLNGPKAWNRWLVFSNRYEQRAQYQTTAEQKIEVNRADRVVQELEKTKQFLAGKDVRAALEDGSLRRWVAFNQVTPYFVWLSPVVADWLASRETTVPDHFGTGMNVYKGGITPNSEAFFRQEFEG